MAYIAVYFFSLSKNIRSFTSNKTRNPKKLFTNYNYLIYKLAVQQARHLCLSELWLRKLSPSVLSPFLLYLNTNIPSKRVGILKPEKELSELPEGYKSDLLEYYLAKSS